MSEGGNGDVLEVDVYRSSRHMDMFLFVAPGDDLSRVPEPLLRHFGEPEFSFSFELSASRRMVRANAAEVLRQLADTGYYLQMPPGKEQQV